MKLLKIDIDTQTHTNAGACEHTHTHIHTHTHTHTHTLFSEYIPSMITFLNVTVTRYKDIYNLSISNSDRMYLFIKQIKPKGTGEGRDGVRGK